MQKMVVGGKELYLHLILLWVREDCVVPKFMHYHQVMYATSLCHLESARLVKCKDLDAHRLHCHQVKNLSGSDLIRHRCRRDSGRRAGVQMGRNRADTFLECLHASISRGVNRVQVIDNDEWC